MTAEAAACHSGPVEPFIGCKGKMTKIQQKVVIITPLHQYTTINVNLHYIHGRK